MRERTSFFNTFISEFEKQLPLTKDYQSAFHAATNKFEETVGQAPYKTWGSFKAQRSKRNKRK
jgi:hypothetical protein